MIKKAILMVIIVGLYACKKDEGPTTLPAPLATDATFITNDRFTANWNAVTGATAYELDVAADPDFFGIIGTDPDASTGTIIFGLESNTQYFYRVRASSSSEQTSVNSNEINVFTLPNAPQAIPGTDITSSGFTANWTTVSEIDNYLLFISTDNFASDPPEYVAGYDGVEVTGTSFVVTGLDSGTLYYFAIKAKGENSTSFFSNSILVVTSN